MFIFEISYSRNEILHTKSKKLIILSINYFIVMLSYIYKATMVDTNDLIFEPTNYSFLQLSKTLKIEQTLESRQHN